jgi:hypothetical protein
MRRNYASNGFVVNDGNAWKEIPKWTCFHLVKGVDTFGVLISAEHRQERTGLVYFIYRIAAHSNLHGRICTLAWCK